MFEKRNLVKVNIWKPINMVKAKEMARKEIQAPENLTHSQMNLFFEKHAKKRQSKWGHVSIQTKNPRGYYSLFPADKDRKHDLFEIEKHACHTYADDLEAENYHQPDVTISLYGLDGISISDKFDEISTHLKGWVPCGSNALTRSNDETAESCASLAYRLLVAGGLFHETNRCFSSKASAFLTPEALEKIVKSAEKQELNTHPEIKHFKSKQSNNR